MGITKESIEFLLSIMNPTVPAQDRDWISKLWKACDELKQELDNFKEQELPKG